MKLPDLLPYLLANRHRLTGDTIADCLDLALMLNESPPGRPILWQTLADRWSCRSAPHVTQRLRRLRKADLVDYEPGCPYHPGYQFHRIGPV